MNKNIKIAKELVKLAKNLVALDDEYDGASWNEYNTCSEPDGISDKQFCKKIKSGKAYKDMKITYTFKNGKIANSVSSEVKRLYEEVMTRFAEMSHVYDRVCAETQSMIVSSMGTIIQELKYLVKSSDYAYEQEMRIVLWRPLSDLKRDDIDIQVTPITDKYPIPKIFVYTTKSIPIEEIILGPKVVETDDIIPFMTKKLLELNNYASDEVIITKSVIEYR